MHGAAVPAPRPEPVQGSAVMSRDVPAEMADRLIVALDVPSPEVATELVAKLDGVVSFFKIGLWLLFAEGTDRLIDKLIRDDKNVFLDYKMFDIGETVKEGVARARERGVKFVTVHGDDAIMRAAVEGKGESDFLKIFAITVLTSMSDEDLAEMGYRLTVKELIAHRVRKAIACQCDGIIASAHDDPNEIRRLVNDQSLLIATPGVRPYGHSVDDHKRSSNPAQAVRDGADYIIMGRPIVQSPDPVVQAQRVVEQMKMGLSPPD